MHSEGLLIYSRRVSRRFMSCAESCRNPRPSTKEDVMTNFTHKFSKLVLGATIQVVAVALFFVVFGVSAVFAQTRAYVTNALDNTVSVIDSATNTVVATVPVGITPEGVAVTPDGAYAYVANFNNNTVSVIAAATNTVVATVPVGKNPFGTAITPDGAFAYVANDTTISVIDI